MLQSRVTRKILPTLQFVAYPAQMHRCHNKPPPQAAVRASKNGKFAAERVENARNTACGGATDSGIGMARDSLNHCTRVCEPAFDQPPLPAGHFDGTALPQ